MNRTDEGQNRGTIMKEAEARAAAIASMKRKTGAHGYEGRVSRVGYRQAPPDKKGMSIGLSTCPGYGQVLPDNKGMSNGSRGGEADHAADGSRNGAEKKGWADDEAILDHCQRATGVGSSTCPVAVDTIGSSHPPGE